MALRVKCKCGKALKISSKLAGKKLTCPACSRPFRIPAEKFKAAEAAAKLKTAAKRAPAQPKPPPAPIELDIQPTPLDQGLQNLDADPPTAPEFAHSGVLDDLAPDVLQAAGAPAPPVAVPVELETPMTAYAPEPSKRGSYAENLSAGAIQGPRRSFWRDTFTAFIYPVMNRANAVTFGVITFFVLLPGILTGILPFLTAHIGVLAAPVVVLAMFVSCLIFFWILALYLSVVLDTAAGSDDLPGFTMTHGLLDDVVRPAFRFVGAFLLAMLPAILLFLGLRLQVVPASMGFLLYLLLAAGAFLIPIVLILISFEAGGMLLRPDLIVMTLARTIGPYLAMWLMLLLVFFVRMLATSPEFLLRWGLDIVPSLPDFGAVGRAVFEAMELYFTLVSMRIIGLYYLHYKQRFAIVME